MLSLYVKASLTQVTITYDLVQVENVSANEIAKNWAEADSQCNQGIVKCLLCAGLRARITSVFYVRIKKANELNSKFHSTNFTSTFS